MIKLSGDITRHEIDYQLNFECKSSSFYLPKIQKSNLIKGKYKEANSSYLELRTPFQPVVAGPVCETYWYFIKTFYWPCQKLCERWYRLSLSVTFGHKPKYNISLFWRHSISHSLRLKTIEFWLDKHPSKIHWRFNKQFIFEGIKSFLGNNNFLFDSQSIL